MNHSRTHRIRISVVGRLATSASGARWREFGVKSGVMARIARTSARTAVSTGLMSVSALWARAQVASEARPLKYEPPAALAFGDANLQFTTSGERRIEVHSDRSVACRVGRPDGDEGLDQTSLARMIRRSIRRFAHQVAFGSDCDVRVAFNTVRAPAQGHHIWGEQPSKPARAPESALVPCDDGDPPDRPGVIRCDNEEVVGALSPRPPPAGTLRMESDGQRRGATRQREDSRYVPRRGLEQHAFEAERQPSAPSCLTGYGRSAEQPPDPAQHAVPGATPACGREATR